MSGETGSGADALPWHLCDPRDVQRIMQRQPLKVPDELDAKMDAGEGRDVGATHVCSPL